MLTTTLVDRVLSPIRNQITELLTPVRSTYSYSVLDVGCGTGDQLLRLLQLRFENNNIEFYGLGIDINSKSIEYAREQLMLQDGIQSNATKIEYRVASLFDLYPTTSTTCPSSPPPMEEEEEEDKGVLEIIQSTTRQDSDPKEEQHQQMKQKNQKFDIVMTTLFLDVLPWNIAIQTLSTMLTEAMVDDGIVIVCGFVPPTNLRDKILLWIDQRFTSHYTNFRKYIQNNAIEGIVNELNTNKNNSNEKHFDDEGKKEEEEEHNNETVAPTVVADANSPLPRSDDVVVIKQIIETNDPTIRIYILKKGISK